MAKNHYKNENETVILHSLIKKWYQNPYWINNFFDFLSS